MMTVKIINQFSTSTPFSGEDIEPVSSTSWDIEKSVTQLQQQRYTLQMRLNSASQVPSINVNTLNFIQRGIDKLDVLINVKITEQLEN